MRSLRVGCVSWTVSGAGVAADRVERSVGSQLFADLTFPWHSLHVRFLKPCLMAIRKAKGGGVRSLVSSPTQERQGLRVDALRDLWLCLD